MASLLPTEIWLQIFSYWEREKRLSYWSQLSQCSKQFNLMCVPVLWRCIHVNCMRATIVYDILSLLIRRPDVHHSVRHLNLTYPFPLIQLKFPTPSDSQRSDIIMALNAVPGVTEEFRQEALNVSSAALLQLLVQFSGAETVTLKPGISATDIWKFWRTPNPVTMPIPPKIVSSWIGKESLPENLHGVRSLSFNLEDRAVTPTFMEQLNTASETLEELRLLDPPSYKMFDETIINLSNFSMVTYLQAQVPWLTGGRFTTLLPDGWWAQQPFHRRLPPRLRTLRLTSERDEQSVLLFGLIGRILEQPVEPGCVTSSLKSIELVLTTVFPYYGDIPNVIDRAERREPPLHISIVSVPWNEYNTTRPIRELENDYHIVYSTRQRTDGVVLNYPEHEEDDTMDDTVVDCVVEASKIPPGAPGAPGSSCECSARSAAEANDRKEKGSKRGHGKFKHLLDGSS